MADRPDPADVGDGLLGRCRAAEDYAALLTRELTDLRAEHDRLLLALHRLSAAAVQHLTPHQTTPNDHPRTGDTP